MIDQPPSTRFPTALRLAAVAVSALLLALAYPPWDRSATAWVALAPFLAALRGLRPRAGLALGWVWGTMAVWGIGSWVPGAFANYYQQPLWFGVVFALGASIVFAGSYAAGFAACVCLIERRVRPVNRPLVVAALWVSWELARARLLTGDPWILLGYAVVPETRLIQMADVGGVYLVAFVVVLVNVALVEACAAWQRGPGPALRALAPAAVALAVALGYGTARLATPYPAPTTRIAIVQGNNDLGTLWRQEFYGEGLSAYLEDSYGAAREHAPQLIVWPENSVSFFLADEPRFRTAIGRLATDTGADLIVGGPHREGGASEAGRFFNSAFLVGTDGAVHGRYDKTHLLPFAEYFPLRMIEFLRRPFERVRSFTPGGTPEPLQTSIGPIATVICFEAIFPELVREQMQAGATVLLNLSNDAWLGPGAGPAQHLAMVRVRAVEHRVWILRAATTGISAVIDPFGRVVAATEPFRRSTLHATVAPQAIATVYKRFGDWFAYACLVLSAAEVAAAAISVRSARASRHTCA